MTCAKDILKDQILLANAGTELVDLVRKFIKIRDIKEGDYICFQGDEQSPLILLIEGQLRVSTFSRDGIEIPVSVVNPNQCAGEISILNRTPLCANVAAVRDSTVGLLDRVHARQLINEPNVARSLNTLMARRYLDLIVDRGTQSQPRAGARVSAVIEATLDAHPSSNSALVELPSQSTIAAMAKVSRETVSRVISSLEKRGIIKRVGKAILVQDRLALHQFAGC
jgi:CRP/FNR family transcriptional regulator, cyclic AMP receptor protein